MTIRLAHVLVLAGAIPACMKASPTPKDGVTTMRATGQFDVKVSPVPAGDKSDGPAFGRFVFDKRFHGDVEAVSAGEMLAFGDGRSGAGAYVALERVTGTVRGRKGTFVLQHNGTMVGGTPHMIVTVVPESGTDELSGLAGTMTIHIVDGNHSFDFDYTLPDAARQRP